MPQPAGASPRVPLGFLERLPKWLIISALTVQWLALALRHRSATLPSIANPKITAGGLVGEAKSEYFRSMGPLGRAATAPWVVLPAMTRDATSVAQATSLLGYPLIAKPELGLCGFGVQRIDDANDLVRYLAGYPAEQALMLQAYVAQEGEAGLFYARRPGAAKGSLVGLALRRFPRLIGDGRQTVDELIVADARLRRLSTSPQHRPATPGHVVPAAGETLRLATIGSTRVGGLYLDGGHLVTPALTASIDAIAQEMDEFCFGRFDVRFDSEAALARGEGFTIIEVNGAGSEAIEAWDPALSPRAALRKIFAKQSLMFAIAATNRQRGHRPISLRELARLNALQQALLDRYPPSN